MNKEQLKSTAIVVMNKVNSLGFSKDGKPMVIDQAFEVVAAQAGFRNQHALRASLSADALPAEHNRLSEADGEHLWHSTWITQAWNDESKIIHLEGFLREMGLMAKFATYAHKAAEEENKDSLALLDDEDIDLSSSTNYSFSIGALSRDALVAEALQRDVEFTKWSESGDIRASLMDWYLEEERRVAQAAFESFEFDATVEASAGWCSNGDSFSQVVFLAQDGGPTRKVTFALRVVNLKAVDVHVVS